MLKICLALKQPSNKNNNINNTENRSTTTTLIRTTWKSTESVVRSFKKWNWINEELLDPAQKRSSLHHAAHSLNVIQVKQWWNLRNKKKTDQSLSECIELYDRRSHMMTIERVNAIIDQAKSRRQLRSHGAQFLCIGIGSVILDGVDYTITASTVDTCRAEWNQTWIQGLRH